MDGDKNNRNFQDEKFHFFSCNVYILDIYDHMGLNIFKMSFTAGSMMVNLVLKTSTLG